MNGVNQDGLTCLVSYHFFIVSMKESLVRRFIWFMFISVFSEEWRQTETNKQLNNLTNINGKSTVYIGGFLLHKSAIETMFILGNRPRSWHSSLWPSGPPVQP